MPIIKLTETGAIILPDEILKTLTLKPGDSVSVEPVVGGVLIKLHSPPGKPVQSTLKESIDRKNLSTPMQFIKGVGPKLAETLARKGVNTVEDALYLLPHRYEDRSTIVPLARLSIGSTQVFQGVVAAAEAMTTKGGRGYFEVLLKDQSGTISLKWFNFNPQFMKRTWRIGRKGIFTGHVGHYGLQREVHHPEVEWLAEEEDVITALARDPSSYGRIVPVYPLTEGLSQKIMRKVLKEAVEHFSGCISDHLPPQLRQSQNLLPIADAIREVHFPETVTKIDILNNGDFPAHRTLVFDEFYFLELGMALKKRVCIHFRLNPCFYKVRNCRIVGLVFELPRIPCIYESGR